MDACTCKWKTPHNHFCMCLLDNIIDDCALMKYIATVHYYN